MGRNKKIKGKYHAIKFICKHCDYEISADKKHAGKRTDCPKCGSLITIPKSSSTNLIMYEDNSFFKSEKLNLLFSDFIDEYEDKILQQKITKDGDDVKLDILIQTSLFRSQIVTLCYVIFDNGEEWLGAYSSVGNIKDSEELGKILAKRKLLFVQHILLQLMIIFSFR